MKIDLAHIYLFCKEVYIENHIMLTREFLSLLLQFLQKYQFVIKQLQMISVNSNFYIIFKEFLHFSW